MSELPHSKTRRDVKFMSGVAVLAKQDDAGPARRSWRSVVAHGGGQKEQPQHRPQADLMRTMAIGQ